MTEPAPSQRESDDLRPVPGDKPGVYWNAMRVGLAVVVAFLIFFFVWLAFWH
ncbi:MAG TPA: hypothetical protein VFL60_10605 [Gaiellaceae bacterium]|nr:hypothetical protein [Gaiellaceae bacterium]